MAFLPVDQRIPGPYQKVILQNTPGLLQLGRSVVLVAYRNSALTTVNDEILIEVRTRSEAQNVAGLSLADLGVKSILDNETNVKNQTPAGSLPSVFLSLVPPPIGPSVANVKTATVVGVPSENGFLITNVEGNPLIVQTTTIDTATDIAARLDTAHKSIGNDTFLQSGVAAAVVTMTAREIGAIGNDTYFAVDDTNAPGVTVTVVETVPGTGVVDLTAAMEATLADPDIRIGAIVAMQGDPQTGLDLADHIEKAWTFDTDSPRVGFYPVPGDLSDAMTEAAAIDDLRIAVTVNEKLAGVGTPFDPNSGQSMVSTMTAGAAAVLFSQDRPNHNFNGVEIAGHAREQILRDELNDAINAGVMVFAQRRGVATIVDPITSALTDQTDAATGAPNKVWQPIEYVKVIREIWEQFRFVARKFSTADFSEQTRGRAQEQFLATLRDARGAGWIAAVDESSVTVELAQVGGSVRLQPDARYTPLPGVDQIEISHFVSPATNQTL